MGAALASVYLQGPALFPCASRDVFLSVSFSFWGRIWKLRGLTAKPSLQLPLDLSLVVTFSSNIHSGFCLPLAVVLTQGGTELHSCHMWDPSHQAPLNQARRVTMSEYTRDTMWVSKCHLDSSSFHCILVTASVEASLMTSLCSRWFLD